MTDIPSLKSLTEIDKEIQALLRMAIAEDGNISEVNSIEKSIQEAEQSAIKSGRKIVSFALLLQLSAA